MCIIHLCSVFTRPQQPSFLLHFLLAYFSFPPFLCPVYWERTRTFSLEGFLSGWQSSCLSSLSLFIRNGSTSFHYQMVFAILLEIVIPHL